jgi:hypothetical protein
VTPATKLNGFPSFPEIGVSAQSGTNTTLKNQETRVLVLCYLGHFQMHLRTHRNARNERRHTYDSLVSPHQQEAVCIISPPDSSKTKAISRCHREYPAVPTAVSTCTKCGFIPKPGVGRLPWFSASTSVEHIWACTNIRTQKVLYKRGAVVILPYLLYTLLSCILLLGMGAANTESLQLHCHHFPYLQQKDELNSRSWSGCNILSTTFSISTLSVLN